MAELKTKKTRESVKKFIDSVDHDGRREDAKVMLKLLRDVTGETPSMWGDSMVGFGHYDYTYASGRSGSYFKIGFSPRKRDLTVYLMDGTDKYAKQLSSIGPHKTGVSCLYLPRLDKLDLDALREVLTESWNAPAMGA
ncbi:MAG: DUF1801 domain-containing protein [Microthrixaceae bacterium]